MTVVSLHFQTSLGNLDRGLGDDTKVPIDFSRNSQAADHVTVSQPLRVADRVWWILSLRFLSALFLVHSHSSMMEMGVKVLQSHNAIRARSMDVLRIWCIKASEQPCFRIIRRYSGHARPRRGSGIKRERTRRLIDERTYRHMTSALTIQDPTL